MTRGERRFLLAGAVVLALVCAAFFARAVLAQRAADVAHGQVSAALFARASSPSSDAVDRAMLRWSGATGELRYWQALQRFRSVARGAKRTTQYTLSPSLPLVFRLEETVSELEKTAATPDTPERRSRLEDMLGLGFYYDALIHQGEDPVEPELDGKAIAAFRQAVLLDSSNDAAKSNLELVLLKQRQLHKVSTPHQKPIPDTGRSDQLIQSATGLPNMNGARGRRIRGGY
jgi:hypothetical protein